MPRDAVSRTANVERTAQHKWVNVQLDAATIDVNQSEIPLRNLKKIALYSESFSIIFIYEYSCFILIEDMKEL